VGKVLLGPHGGRQMFLPNSRTSRLCWCCRQPS